MPRPLHRKVARWANNPGSPAPFRGLSAPRDAQSCRDTRTCAGLEACGWPWTRRSPRPCSPIAQMCQTADTCMVPAEPGSLTRADTPAPTIGLVDDIRRIDAPTARRFLVARHQLVAPPVAARQAWTASGPRSRDSARSSSTRWAVAGRNHDLVLHARVRGLPPRVDGQLLYETRELYETYNKGLSLVPTARAAVVPHRLGPRLRRPRAERPRATRDHGARPRARSARGAR